MRIKYFLSIGIIMPLLIILTGCPMECVAPYTIKQKITILPQNDTIHVGDTLKFSTSFDAFYTAYDKNVDISDKEINLKCYISSFNNSDYSPFYTDTDILSNGIENFDFSLKKGIIKNSDIIYDDEAGSNREFYYELNNDKFELELEIIAKEPGNYILDLFSNEYLEYPAKYCEKNFDFSYYFEITDKHLLNDFYKGIHSKNTFYAFVVVE